MPAAAPSPGVGQAGDVTLNGYDLQLRPGSYQRVPAPRFGDKVSTGDLRYQDFNTYESAVSFSAFEGGYGIRRYSDLDLNAPNPTGYYRESSNVDAREAGILLSPALTTVTLPNSAANPVWMGEWTPSAGAVTGPHWVIVAGAKVYYLSAIGTAVDTGYTLSSTAVQGAVVGYSIQGSSGGQLIIGYGAAHTAEYITTLDASVGVQSVQDTGASALYVFAATADRAAVYVAGGTSATNHTNAVTSAATTAANPGQSFATSASYTFCGSHDAPITGLAPGGGIVIVFVGKTTELGWIDDRPVYQTLVPFNSRRSTNCVGMNWWAGGGATGNPVGPQVIVFPRNRSIWAFTPSAVAAGSALNLAPWGKNGFRPANARGLVTAFQGTEHYLYYAVQTTGGNTWIIANDAITGANHTYRYQAANNCYSMGITALFGSNPTLYFCYGNNIAYVVLPQDGDYPIDGNGAVVSGVTFDTGSSNTFTLADIDGGFPDEDKVAISVRLTGDSITTSQFVTVAYATEGSSTYTTLGTFNVGPFQELVFPTGTSSIIFKRLSLQLTFTTTSASLTPVLQALSLRFTMNPKQYTLWNFEARMPAGLTKAMTQSMLNVHNVMNSFWSTYKAGLAVSFRDRWNDTWNVRLLDFKEIETVWEQGKAPESTLAFQLLELGQTYAFLWGSTFIWGQSQWA